MKKNIIKSLVLAGITVMSMGTNILAASNTNVEEVEYIQYEQAKQTNQVNRVTVDQNKKANEIYTTEKTKKIGDNIFLVDTEEKFLDTLINMDKEKACYIYATKDMSNAVKKYAPIVESSSAGFLASYKGKVKGYYAYYISPKHYNSNKNFNRNEFKSNEQTISQWITNSGARYKGTDMEKIKAFAVYVKNNSCYDKINTWEASSNIYSVTRTRRGKCYGFASLTHRALLQMGIKNYSAMTVGNTHIANRALVDGKWITIDLTPSNTWMTNSYNYNNVNITSLSTWNTIKVNYGLESRLNYTNIKIFDKALGL